MKTDAVAFITRLKDALALRWDKDLSQVLGVSQSHISKAQRNGIIPDRWILKLEMDKGLRKEFLLHGEGEPFMPGPTQLAACDPNKKWATAIFSPNGEESVSSAYPAAGIVTNASGLALPVHHYAEYVLALEIRPQSDAEGNPVLTGSGMPLPLERIRRWKADPAGMRSLRTARNFIIFDASQRDEMPGEIFVIRMRNIFIARRLVLGERNLEYVALDNSGPNLVVRLDDEGNPTIMGRVLMLCTEM